MSKRSVCAIVLMAFLGWSGCRAGVEPEALYAQAEGLRLTYKKEAARQAITKYREAMSAWRRKGDRPQAARAGQRIGATLGQLGSLLDALEAYQAALSLAREAPAHLLESEIRSDIGMVKSLVADREEVFEEARGQCQLALELARQQHGEREVAKAFNCLGDAAYYRQHAEEALGFYREAEAVWDRLGDPQGKAQTLLLQGHVYSDLGRFDQARSCYVGARSLWTSLRDDREQAITLVADARLHARRGEYQDALTKFEEALTRLEPMGDALWEGGSLAGIAEIHLYMAETGSALRHWERALQIFERAGLRNVEVDVLMSLGAAYLASGDDTKALSRFERALAVANELGIERWKAFALRFIGVVHLFRLLPRQAQQYLAHSLDVQRSLSGSGGLRLEARTRTDLGEAHHLLGEHEVAAKYLNDALVMSRAAGDRVTEARGLFALARTSVGLDDLDTARQHIEHALKVAESLRTEVENRDLRASYFASVYRWHELHVDVMMRLSKARQNPSLIVAAFEASERARARSLLESLLDAEVDVRTGVDADLLEREQVLKKSFGEWAERHRRLTGAAGSKGDGALAQEYRDLEYRYNQIQAEIRIKSPRYAALVRPQALNLKEVQSQLLDSDTLLLEYSLGEERSYLWVISNKDHTSYELPSRTEIDRAAQRVYELLTARLAVTGDQQARRRRVEQADADYWQEAARLSEILLGPVGRRMAGKRLLLVTDGALQYLPFAALPVPGARGTPVPMVVEHEIVNLPSASVLAVLRRETAGKALPGRAVAVLADPVFDRGDPRLLSSSPDAPQVKTQSSAGSIAAELNESANQALRGVGFSRDGSLSIPRLIATRQEADDIVAMAPEGMKLKAVDFDASRATAIGPELRQYRIVHFATHGVFNNEDPGLSGIILSMFDKQGHGQDGFLRLHDIYSLKLPAELVVLSACNTALGKPVKGEGLVGMVRGFMYAGAKRVVASYWKVDDEATGALMSRFYDEMLKQNRSPAAALRAAQLEMIRHDRWRTPYYWAAFVLQGEWK